MKIMLDKVLDSIKAKLGDYSKYLIFLIVVLIFMSLARNVMRMKRAGGRIEKAAERVEELRKENEELKKLVEEVKSDEFIEGQLRDKLNLAKEGEIVIVLPDDEVLRSLAPKHVEEEEVLPDPNWKRWMKQCM